MMIYNNNTLPTYTYIKYSKYALHSIEGMYNIKYIKEAYLLFS